MLAYVDESGHPHYKDSCERPVLAAVCIPTAEVKALMQKMYNIKMDIFGKSDVELKASNVIKRKSLTKNFNNKLFAEKVVKDVLCRIIGLKVFAIIMERPEKELVFPSDSFPNHYRFLLQRINGYTNRWEPQSKAIVAFDSQDEGNDKIISDKMKGYLFKSREGQECEHIVESAFFVSSKVEEGIQLADLCAGIIRLHHELTMPGKERDEFSDWVMELYGYIQTVTCNVYSPSREQSLYGIYQMPHRFLDCYEKKEDVIAAS